LTKRLAHPNFGMLALQTLGQMGPTAKEAAPALVQKLSDPGTLNLRELCLTLAFLRPSPDVAGPALQQIANRSGDAARPAAIYALGRCGDRSALKMITNLVEDSDPIVQMAAAWSLLELDPQDRDIQQVAIPKVIKALERPDPRIRREAAMTLRQLGPAAAAAAPQLVARLQNDPEFEVRLACLLAISEMGAAAKPAIPLMVDLLDSPEPMSRRAALYTLGRLGPVAAEALPAVKHAAAHGPSAEQTIAIWATLRISNDEATLNNVLPMLLARIPNESTEVVVELVTLLGETTAPRPEVITFLKAQASSEDEAIQTAAKRAMTKLGQ
jgi:HEAT repeat protein